MPQYCVANSLPSGVGSEKAISSLLKYEPYIKLLLFKNKWGGGGKKKHNILITQTGTPFKYN